MIQAGKCSEMDILLDLWIHTVYNDPSVLCSDTGPVVYYRNNTGSPLTSFQTLGERWGHSTYCLQTIKSWKMNYNHPGILPWKSREHDLPEQLPFHYV